MNERTNNIYLEWLALEIGVDTRDYYYLLKVLFEKEFVWLVANDDNRISDGLELRMEFLDEHPREDPADLIDYVCVLEVIAALTRRLEFQTDIPAIEWGTKLLRNLSLTKYKGQLTQIRENHVNDILDRLVWRQYGPNGVGGLFPLERPKEDQTQVEIWYQASAYILEHQLV